jgi:hypothetical protein
MLPQKETKANNHQYKKSVSGIFEVRLEKRIESAADFVDFGNIGHSTHQIISGRGPDFILGPLRVALEPGDALSDLMERIGHF